MTSLNAWLHVNDTGSATARREQIYNYIATHPRSSNKNIARGLGIDPNRVSPHTGELRASGRIIEDGTKKDEESGVTVICWVITEEALAEIYEIGSNRVGVPA